MSKRSFGVDTTALATVAPTLDEGYYAGYITGAAIASKDGKKQYINIQKEKVWNKDSKQMDETGKWVIQGMMMYGVTLTSKRAIKALGIDEPRIFGGMMRVETDDQYRIKPSHVLGDYLAKLGLKEINFDAETESSWEGDDNIQVPDDLKDVPDVITMLNALAYIRTFFNLIAQSSNGIAVKAKVLKKATRDNAELMENVLDQGTFSAPYCGFNIYSDGFENDLEDDG